MYSYEERKRAVDLYIQLGHRAKTVKRQLGYPRDESTIIQWYKEYQANGELRKARRGVSQYTPEQREAAIAHYFSHGRNMCETVRALGYPHRAALRRWLEKERPGEKRACKSGGAHVYFTPKQIEEAALALCNRTESAREVAERLHMCRPSLYRCKWKLLGKGADVSMAKEKPKQEELRQENDMLQANNQRLRREAEELSKKVYRLQLEVDVLTEAEKLLKKGRGVDLKALTNREKAVLIDALRPKYKLHELLSVLDMAKSSYCYQKNALQTPDKYAKLRADLRTEFEAAKKRYGYRRLQLELRRKGTMVSEKVIRRLMREEGLEVPRGSGKKYSSYMGEISPAVENVLQRDFHADKPNEKWLTDITEFHIPAGKVYLSPLIDCFDGLPMAWRIGTSPNAELANTMLDDGIRQLKPGERPIVHTDRGCHYRWPGWIERMEKAGLTRSMSKKGCSPDNAACEGFHGHLKTEFFYYRDWQNVSLEEFIRQLDEYLRWFREKRIKVSLGGMSPMEYRRGLGLVA